MDSYDSFDSYDRSNVDVWMKSYEVLVSFHYRKSLNTLCSEKCFGTWLFTGHVNVQSYTYYIFHMLFIGEISMNDTQYFE